MKFFRATSPKQVEQIASASTKRLGTNITGRVSLEQERRASVQTLSQRWVTGVSYLFTSKQGGSRIVHSGALHDQRDNGPPSDRRKGSLNAPLCAADPGSRGGGSANS